MTTSLPNHGPSERPGDGFGKRPLDEDKPDIDNPDIDNPDEARLHGLSHQQLTDRLTWLAWYQPGIFTAVMDYMQFSDDLAADTDAAGPDLDTLDHDEEPAPASAPPAPPRV